MMVKPTVSELLKNVNNRFELVVATAKRARQLSKGDTPLVNNEEESTVTLAADEIAEGKVTVVEENETYIQNENIENIDVDNVE